MNSSMAGENMPYAVCSHQLGVLYKLGVEVILHGRLYGADGKTVFMEHILSGEPMIFDDVDTLVVSNGHFSDDTLESALLNFKGELHLIGDCLATRTAKEAVYDGLKVGVAL